MQYFNAAAVQQLVSAHERDIGDTSYQLWSLITFSLWHQIFIEKAGRGMKILIIHQYYLEQGGAGISRASISLQILDA